MQERRLAAILVTDVVGFTAMMAADQDRALKLVHRSHQLIKSIVSSHTGKWLEDTGDRSITSFSSAVNAVECAFEILQKTKEDPDLNLRIGIDLGETIVSKGHVYGDAVNIASIVEQFADPNGIVITHTVFEAVHSHVDTNIIDLGEKSLKNVDHAVRLYALSGIKQRSRFGNFLAVMMIRRIPHIVGAYLAASWAFVEVVDWLSVNGLFSRLIVYGIVTALIALIPSVVLVTYTHGAHGKDRLTQTEKFAVPLNIVIAIILFVVVPQYVKPFEDNSPIEEASVAVLPFVNFDDSNSDDSFGLGLAEELINVLAKVPGLYVASRTSSFSFDGQTQDPITISKHLRVAAILEGSVRRHGNQLRITAQLIDGRNNYHLWSETYSRELKDVFTIQEDIARAVATELTGVLMPDVSKALKQSRVVTLEVYELYLEGLRFLRQPPTPTSLANAKKQFLRALTKDPDYAQAHAALCELLLEQYRQDRSASLIDEAQSYCQRALAIDDSLREVRYSQGVLYRHTGDYDQSAKVFRSLLAGQPNARAWVGLGWTYDAQSNTTAAKNAFQKAIDLEPGNWINRIALAEFLYLRGHFTEALEALNRILEISPDNARAYLLIGACYDYLGDLDASLEATLKSIQLSPTRAAYRDLGLAYHYSGDLGKAAVAYKHAVELGPDDHYSWGNLALVYSLIDGKAEASQVAFKHAIQLAAEVLERNPQDWTTMARLALYEVLTGATEDGIERVGVAVANASQSYSVHYQDALIHVYLNQERQALDAIELVIGLGYPVRVISNEPRFKSLRNNERFISLINKNMRK